MPELAEPEELARLFNGQAISLSEVRGLSLPEFHAAIKQRIEAGGQLSALFGVPPADNGRLRLYAVVGDRSTGFLDAHFRHSSIRVDSGQVRSPHSQILVQQKTGAIDAAIVVE